MKEDSRLLSDLYQIEAYDINLADHPSVAALAAALEYFIDNEPDSGLTEPEPEQLNPWDYL